ncbi:MULTISPECIES: hypothetical protein [unclassified Streptomyces]|uniref:hypothetical protein n=1 Tax=unclassified Streptomyces TaxID=2593676 RepID=UPI0033BE1038
MKRALRSTTTVLMAAAGAFGLVLVTNSPAFAADQWRTDLLQDDVYLDLIRDGSMRGQGYFRADPVNGAPGDSFSACDRNADGKGIEVHRKFNGSTATWKVMASTRGHSAGYCTGDITDNMTENTYLAVRLCIVEGTHQTCGPEQWTIA